MTRNCPHLYFLPLLFYVVSVASAENLTEISILHINDFHARYEETSVDSGVCKTNTCIGGFSRLFAAVQIALKAKPNSILLNAGDNFEGTLWYTVHKWNVTQYFFNKLPFDAFTLGNHEFEDKIEGLVPFVQHLKSPIVVSNIDATAEPAFQNLVNKSVVIERKGIKIGIIGVIEATTGELADIGNLILLNESSSVNAEAERLVQEEGVFTNIVLSHCGYEKEVEIAKNATSKISVVVGGHSHTFLYTGEPVPGLDRPLGPYPTVVDNQEGKKVLVVQAASYSKYLGNLTVFYNNEGEVVSWSGRPIYLDSSAPQDESINEELLPWKAQVDQQGNQVVGSTLVRLDQSTCATKECLIGNVVADAMVFAYTLPPSSGAWTNGSIAIVNAISLRSGIDVGNITYNEIVSAQPFKNTVDIGELKGIHLKEILESSVTINLLQVSGIQVVYNLSLPEGSRLKSLKLRCQKCLVPVYKEVEDNEDYRIILPSFLADGGLNFKSIKTYLKNRQRGELDVDVISRYIASKSPVFEEIQGRIEIVR